MLKRDPVKYIRDKAKAAYEKADSCHICGKEITLDFHHYYTLTPLLNKWLESKRLLRPDHYTDEYITIWRDEFIDDKWKELYQDTVTICHEHHLKLHSIYGRNPPLHSAEKQKRWVTIQREKHGLV